MKATLIHRRLKQRRSCRKIKWTRMFKLSRNYANHYCFVE